MVMSAHTITLALEGSGQTRKTGVDDYAEKLISDYPNILRAVSVSCAVTK